MDNEDDNNNEVKCIVIGDTAVGKSCLIYRYISNSFDSKSLSTLGAMYYPKIIEKDNKNYTLNIWDTAGQELYKTITNLYYRDTQAALIVFDCTNIDSQNNIFNWIKDVKDKNQEEITIYALCNKIDLNPDYKVNLEFMDKLNKLNIKLFYTSAKENKNIKELFDELIDDVIKLKILNENNIDKRNTVIINNKGTKKKKKCC